VKDVATEWREEPGWRDNIAAAGRDLLDNHIGPAILADMQHGCPIDTGKLLTSLDKAMVDDETLRVGSRDVDYTVFVVEGHRIVYRNRDGDLVDTGRIQPGQDFMRPALYRRRGL
jgi:hypothetical protein